MSTPMIPSCLIPTCLFPTPHRASNPVSTFVSKRIKCVSLIGIAGMFIIVRQRLDNYFHIECISEQVCE